MQALILCGGMGERLRPLTQDRPKPMLEINGRPLLELIIEHLKKFGVTNIVLLCGYKHELIEEHFGDGSGFGVSILYSVEKEKLGTGGAVHNARKFVKEDFIVINGDLITNFPLDNFLEIFRKSGKNLMLLVRPNNPFGVAKIRQIDDKTCKIERFEEKPMMNEWINGGYIALKLSTLELFPERGAAERIVYPKLQENGELLGYLVGDKYFWKSIDSIKDWKEIQTAGVPKPGLRGRLQEPVA